jgi:hypothetical protein
MYRITIEKIETVKTIQPHYQKLREPFEDEKEQSFYRESKNKPENPQYGYVHIEEESNVVTKVLEQTTDELDLPAVIKAINKI